MSSVKLILFVLSGVFFVHGQSNTTENITCLSGAPPIPLSSEPSCPPGFYCPFLPLLPTYCTPTPECTVTRLSSVQCDSQGTTEPLICPKGNYCPNATTMIQCPVGHYCHTGSTKPHECPIPSSCPAGSAVPRYYGGLIACLILDALLLTIWLTLRYGDGWKASRVGSIMTSWFSANQENTEIEMSAPDPYTNKTYLRFDLDGLQLTINNKLLLAGVSGSIHSGRVTAIMGPSGAGKTTMMNCLMGKVTPTGGKLYINRAEMLVRTFRHVIGFVPQDDIMIPELTVRENLLHSARIRLPADWSDKKVREYTDKTIKALDLSHVANSLVGDPLTRGISGGQKKRTNIGMELVAAPLAIFLDEPTSGLDSTAALKAANILKDLADKGRTVVAVIHQPRQEIYEVFDDLFLLAPGGRTVYQGPRENVLEYFEKQGHVIDPARNHADQLMDLLSTSADELVNAWNQRASSSTYSFSSSSTFTTGKVEIKIEESNEDEEAEGQITDKKERRGAKDAMKKMMHRKPVSVFYQMLLCHYRSMIQQYRLASSLALECLVAILAGGLMGLAAFGDDDKYKGVWVGQFALLSPAPLEFFTPLVSLLFGMAIGLAGAPAGVNVFSEEIVVFLREVTAGHNLTGYYLGKITSVLARLTLTALHFATIYCLLATPINSFAAIFAISWCFFFCVYGLASIVSLVVRRENAALLGVVVCLFAAVFNGFGPTLQNASDWKLRWLWDISYARWLSEAMFTTSLTPYRDVYQVDQVSAEHWGYSLDRFSYDCGIAVVLGLVFRIIAYGLLWSLPKRSRR